MKQNNTLYSIDVKTIDGETISLDKYQDKVLLIVNVASKCGFTPQYQDLQKLYEKYQSKGFEILAFPCNQFLKQEPGTESEIKNFCETNYHITFPLFSKIDVKGENIHPLYQFLTESAPGLLNTKTIKWNFTKFLVNKNGKVIKRYAPKTKIDVIEKDLDL